ncbi:MAG: CotH kinase family protein [Anaerolineales bacterium]|nr:CotH kinase family protein [Anaerolineales bacterium]
MSLKFKRNYPILLLLAATLALFAFALGDQRIIAYEVQAEGQQSAQALASCFDIANDVALFDDGLVHSIQVLMPEEDYDLMIAAYQETGLKEYFQADIIIDGVQIDDVGIRLKGNASLQTALGGGRGMGGRGARPVGERQQPPEMEAGAEPPEMPADGARPEPPQGFQPPQGMDPPFAPQDGAPGGMGQVAEGEIKIPFLIKFDEYVDGQTYQGYTYLSIRNYGVSPDAAMLHEPLTNAAARLAGLPATQTAYTGFKINDAEETLYVISEIIDETYLAGYFENADGVLYKAEVGSTLSYVDENPSSYAQSFSQETRLNDADLAPLIAFMRFLDQADEAAFESELPNWLDVDSFATYLALNNLLVNTDSMIGMNNNYYLYYDETSRQFTLLMWDANESLSKLGSDATYDLYFSDAGGRGGRGPGMGGGQNVLMARFMANATFKALYEQKVQMIYQQAFASGALSDMAARYSALIHSVNAERGLVDLDAYDQAAEKTLSFISQRAQYLASTELLGTPQSQ